MINSDGSELTNLTSSRERDERFSWSLDGATIVVDGESLKLIDLATPDEKRELATTSGTEECWSWSPDGTKLLFHNKMVYVNEPEKTGWHIWTVNVDGSGLQQLTETKHNFRLAWSPDGSKIAYLSDADGDSELYVMNADGANQIQLTDNSAWELLPSWSLDGSRIAFVRDEKGQPMSFDVWGGDLCVIHADGTGEVRLATDLRSVTLPVWQPPMP